MTTASQSTQALRDAYGHVQPELDKVVAVLDAELQSDRVEAAALCRHLARFRGKMLRPAMLLLCAQATGGVSPIHRNLAAAIEMLHLATLVHDDVLDESGIRRRAVTINAGWGDEAAVMLGDWLISRAYNLCSRQGSTWANVTISSAANRVCEGELAQLFRRGDASLSQADYEAIVEAKTASLTAVSARLGAHFNDAPVEVEDALCDYGRALGVAFQIVDDVLDLAGDEAAAGKTLGSDLAKGKATLPLILYLNAADAAEVERVGRLLGGRAAEADGRLRELLAESGCVAAALAVAGDYVRIAKSRLAGLDDSPAKRGLELLADLILSRDR